MPNPTASLKNKSHIRLLHSAEDFNLIPQIVAEQNLIAIDPYNIRQIPIHNTKIFIPDLPINIILTRPEWIKGDFQINEYKHDYKTKNFIQQQTNFFGFGIFLQSIESDSVAGIGIGQLTSWSSWTSSVSGCKHKTPPIVKKDMHKFFSAIRGTSCIMAAGEIFYFTKTACKLVKTKRIKPHLPFPYEGEFTYLD